MRQLYCLLICCLLHFYAKSQVNYYWSSNQKIYLGADSTTVLMRTVTANDKLVALQSLKAIPEVDHIQNIQDTNHLVIIYKEKVSLTK